MGNCLVLQEQMVKIVKPDGKMLEYKSPVEVERILSDFSGHAVSDSFQAVKYLLPATKLHAGSMYYLIPLPLPLPLPSPSPRNKKKVRFSIPEEDTAVRIRIVISKQELQEMMEGGKAAVDMISRIQKQQRVQKVDVSNYTDDCTGRKPAIDVMHETS